MSLTNIHAPWFVSHIDLASPEERTLNALLHAGCSQPRCRQKKVTHRVTTQSQSLTGIQRHTRLVCDACATQLRR